MHRSQLCLAAWVVALVVSASGCTKLPDGGARQCDPVTVPPQGGVEGELHLLGASAGQDAGLGASIVFLTSPHKKSAPDPHGKASLRLLADGFEREILAVGPGMDVEVENKSGVQHQLFWLEEGTRVDLALAAEPGSTARIRSAGRGVRRIYCDLHTDEYVSLFEAPTPHFAVLDADGAYSLPGVGPGEWTLQLWSERVEGPIRKVQVEAGWVSREDIWIDLRLVRRR